MGSGVAPPLPEAPIKAQIQRLAGLDKFPRGEVAAIRELIRVLRINCASEDHARRAIDLWVTGPNGKECPKPVELVEMAQRTRPAEGRPPNPNCKACEGSGWISETVIVPKLSTRLGRPYEADVCRPCPCRGAAK